MARDRPSPYAEGAVFPLRGGLSPAIVGVARDRPSPYGKGGGLWMARDRPPHYGPAS